MSTVGSTNKMFELIMFQIDLEYYVHGIDLLHTELNK